MGFLPVDLEIRKWINSGQSSYINTGKKTRETNITMGWKLLIISLHIWISCTTSSLSLSGLSPPQCHCSQISDLYLPHPCSLSYWDIFCCLTEHCFFYSTDTVLRFPLPNIVLLKLWLSVLREFSPQHSYELPKNVPSDSLRYMVMGRNRKKSAH